MPNPRGVASAGVRHVAQPQPVTYRPAPPPRTDDDDTATTDS
jgi:hypothetical protein